MEFTSGREGGGRGLEKVVVAEGERVEGVWVRGRQVDRRWGLVVGEFRRGWVSGWL
ncbi:hypothetical protein GCM10009804_46370 [Kribbella hippodromi]|uniref:Uncharacterized protein n=1 Tax=Kribbella hippodromi TaxID=434347 RepID=A0ABN2DS11_9ACTN